jgi:hypothetical protein
MSDEEYAIWRSRQIRVAYWLSRVGFGLSIVALAVALSAKGYFF